MSLKQRAEIDLFGAAYHGHAESERLLIAAYSDTIRAFANKAVGSDEEFREAVAFVKASLPKAIAQARENDLSTPWDYLKGRISGYLQEFKRKQGRASDEVAPARRRIDPTPQEIEARKRELLSFTPMRQSAHAVKSYRHV